MSANIKKKESNVILGTAYFSIAFNALGIFFSSLAFIQSKSKTLRKEFVYPWILWCFLIAALNIGFVIWSSVITGSFNLFYLFGVTLNTTFRLFCGIVGCGYIQWLNTNDGEDEEEEGENMQKYRRFGPHWQLYF